MATLDTAPTLDQFRLELQPNGILHFIFDCPGRPFNIFSNAAILELGAFTAWLAQSDVKGVLVRSGKPTAFCAGADLTELGVAYDMITAAPKPARYNMAFNHFFPLSAGIRALETAGKPVAAAIAGLALGGGCELAMGTHYRVLVDDPAVAMGLPESLVGLLPGAGGTQRVSRLVGLERALPILLDAGRLSGQAAVDAGLVHALARPGEEVAMAEQWLLANPDHIQQPWDRDDWTPASAAVISAAIAPVRAAILAKTLGHYPAELAILDCLEFGLPQCFDGGIRTEMAIFSHLIQRAEPRNMIQAMFLGKTDYDRHRKKETMPAFVADAVATVRGVVTANADKAAALAAAGFAGQGDAVTPVRDRARAGYWVDGADGQAVAARDVLDQIGAALTPVAATLSAEERRLADHAVIRETGYPAYLGGPFAFLARG